MHRRVRRSTGNIANTCNHYIYYVRRVCTKKDCDSLRLLTEVDACELATIFIAKNIAPVICGNLSVAKLLHLVSIYTVSQKTGHA